MNEKKGIFNKIGEWIVLIGGVLSGIFTWISIYKILWDWIGPNEAVGKVLFVGLVIFSLSVVTTISFVVGVAVTLILYGILRGFQRRYLKRINYPSERDD